MATTFTLTLMQDTETALDHIKSGITEAGGDFEGNTNHGAFKGNTPLGTIKGSYLVKNDNKIDITIVKKPMLLSNAAIKSAIEDYLS
ncbi:MAG: hypothetical protein DRG24_02010 [Epsilonproteobacteria bacterium]|nr:MAG: hypothetical protein DRG24_02010 [Campylobacterota bacterium]